MSFEKDSNPWNKGLTKNNSPILKNLSEKHKGENNPMYGKVPWNKGVKMWEIKPHPRGSLGKTPWNKGMHMWLNKEHPRGMLGKRGYVPWNRGLTKENSEKLREMHRKSTETRIRLYEEGKIKAPMFGKHHTEKTKNKISETELTLYREGKIVPTWLGKKNPMLSIRNKMNWESLEYREKVIRKLLEKMKERPTSLEKQMIEIIQKYNLPYKYVGDGSYLIGFKNPDFVNVNGDKICIEVANYFHHQGDWIENRIKHFARYGWKCFIFFENSKGQLDEKDVISSLKKFN